MKIHGFDNLMNETDYLIYIYIYVYIYIYYKLMTNE